MIDARKVLPNIELHNVTTSPHQHLQAIRRGMRALAFSTRIAMRMEVSVKYGLQNVHQHVMHHTVPVRRRRDQSSLGTADPVRGEPARPVNIVDKLPL